MICLRNIFLTNLFKKDFQSQTGRILEGLLTVRISPFQVQTMRQMRDVLQMAWECEPGNERLPKLGQILD